MLPRVLTGQRGSTLPSTMQCVPVVAAPACSIVLPLSPPGESRRSGTPLREMRLRGRLGGDHRRRVALDLLVARAVEVLTERGLVREVGDDREVVRTGVDAGVARGLIRLDPVERGDVVDEAALVVVDLFDGRVVGELEQNHVAD